MEKLSNILTDYIIKKNIISNDSSEIYKYGFQMGLEMFFSMLIGLITAIYMHMLVQYIVMLVIFILLRSYAGGLHLDTYIKCFICSYIVQLGILLWTGYIQYPESVSIILILLTGLFILRLAPVENINRPVDIEEQHYFEKKLKKVLCFIFIVAIIFTICNLNEYATLLVNTMIVVTISMIIGKRMYINAYKNFNN